MREMAHYISSEKTRHWFRNDFSTGNKPGHVCTTTCLWGTLQFGWYIKYIADHCSGSGWRFICNAVCLPAVNLSERTDSDVPVNRVTDTDTGLASPGVNKQPRIKQVSTSTCMAGMLFKSMADFIKSGTFYCVECRTLYSVRQALIDITVRLSKWPETIIFRSASWASRLIPSNVLLIFISSGIVISSNALKAAYKSDFRIHNVGANSGSTLSVRHSASLKSVSHQPNFFIASRKPVTLLKALCWSGSSVPARHIYSALVHNSARYPKRRPSLINQAISLATVFGKRCLFCADSSHRMMNMCCWSGDWLVVCWARRTATSMAQEKLSISGVMRLSAFRSALSGCFSTSSIYSQSGIRMNVTAIF